MGPGEMVIVPADASTLTAADAVVPGRHGPVNRMGPGEMVTVPADASTLTAADAIVPGRHGPVPPQAGPTPGRL